MITKIYTVDGELLSVEVTFAVPSHVWADTIHLVGDFNNWNRSSHPFQRARDGQWTITIGLSPDKVYQFRYLCNGRDWMNDCTADGYVPNPHGCENCLLITQSDFEPHSA